MKEVPHETFRIIEPFLNECGIRMTAFRGDSVSGVVWVFNKEWGGPRIIKARGPIISHQGRKFDLHDPDSLQKLVKFLWNRG